MPLMVLISMQGITDIPGTGELFMFMMSKVIPIDRIQTVSWMQLSGPVISIRVIR